MSTSRILSEDHDIENPNLENSQHFRRRPLKSQSVPEFKLQNQDIKNYVSDFFRNKSPKELALYVGVRSALIVAFAYAAVPVAWGLGQAIPPGLIAGLIGAGLGAGGKIALEKYEDYKKTAPAKGPLP